MCQTNCWFFKQLRNEEAVARTRLTLHFEILYAQAAYRHTSYFHSFFCNTTIGTVQHNYGALDNERSRAVVHEYYLLS